MGGAMQNEVVSFGCCFYPQSEVVPLPTAGFSYYTRGKRNAAIAAKSGVKET